MPDEIVADAYTYWIVQAWSWPLIFISLVCVGFLMISGNKGHVGLVTICSSLVYMYLWTFGSDLLGLPRGLELLCWAFFISQALGAFMHIVLTAHSANSMGVPLLSGLHSTCKRV